MRRLALTPDAWLAGIMARPVHRVAIDDAGVPADTALRDATGFSFIRAPAHDVAAVQDLTDLGFLPVDVGITLECARDSTAGAGVRMATSRDRDAVVAIARNGFRQSRFHLDPAIGKPLADEIKAQWAGNFFAGARGDAMVVAEMDGRVVGFTQLLKTNDAIVIDLIAVDVSARGRGLGSAMIAQAATLAKGRLRVGTQAANTASLRFYENLGFRTVASAYVLHRHA